MEQCEICKNMSVENGFCLNCGRVLCGFQVAYLQSMSSFRMMITSKYLVFGDSQSMGGKLAATAAGGLLGSTIYGAAKRKAGESKIGMIDTGTIVGITVYLPKSNKQGAAFHFNFSNGTDLIVCIFERGVDIPTVINILRMINPNVMVQEVKNYRKLKMNNPIAKKSSQLLVTVSRSATGFLAPFKDMIVVD